VSSSHSDATIKPRRTPKSRIDKDWYEKKKRSNGEDKDPDVDLSKPHDEKFVKIDLVWKKKETRTSDKWDLKREEMDGSHKKKKRFVLDCSGRRLPKSCDVWSMYRQPWSLQKHMQAEEVWMLVWQDIGRWEGRREGLLPVCTESLQEGASKRLVHMVTRSKRGVVRVFLMITTLLST
jgi:hypothetical protein